MTDAEYEDLLIACKGMLISGMDESLIRDELRNRGVSNDDALRLISQLDFGKQNRQSQSQTLYRIAGLIALLIGGIGGAILYFGPEPSLLYRAFFGLAAFGLYFAILGADGIIWRD